MLHSVRNARAAVTPGTVAGSAWRTRGQQSPDEGPVAIAAQAAFTEGRSFGNVLAADTRVTEHLDPKAIAALLDPIAYTGL